MDIALPRDDACLLCSTRRLTSFYQHICMSTSRKSPDGRINSLLNTFCVDYGHQARSGVTMRVLARCAQATREWKGTKGERYVWELFSLLSVSLRRDSNRKLFGGTTAMLISLPSILNWIRHHVLISLGIVLLAALVIWGVGPASFAVTHINMQHCGSLYSALGPQPAGGKVNSQAVRAIDCFVLAHQQCVAASLSYSTHSLDTGTQDTYSTSNSLGGCGLSGHTSSYVDVLQGSSSDFSCSGLQQQPDGLHFLSCGRFGEQIIPVSASV